MDSLPLTQSLFKILHERDRSLVQAVIDHEFSAFAKQMIDFKPLVGVMFLDGWEVCPTFEDFAKPEPLNIKDAALHFNTPVTPFVPEKLLHQGVDRRGTLVDFLFFLVILFRQAFSQESSPSLLQSRLTFMAIRGHLPAFQLALYSWISAKVDCRKVGLQDSYSPYVYTVLSSSPRTPSLFPVEAVLELSRSPALQGLSLLEQMGWTESRHNLLKKERGKLDVLFFFLRNVERHRHIKVQIIWSFH